LVTYWAFAGDFTKPWETKINQILINKTLLSFLLVNLQC
jgi:hypothetical protein